MNQETLKQNDFYRTSNLALATMISLRYPIEAVEKDNFCGETNFLFQRDECLDRLIEQYWKGEIRVEPKIYSNQLKMIETRLYNET